MCGISGIIGNNWNIGQLEKMVLTQEHRGPDFSSTYIDEKRKVGLGHNRLSILDLSAAANQPMLSADKQYVLVFNGEIYNFIELKKELEKDFIFQTSSDTEVLLAAWQKWGTACLNRFNGMFAFAIWDTKKKILFAARDRYGVKPFYYSKNAGNFYFASEIKTLWAAGIERKPYEPVWSGYLSKGTYASNGLTFWDNISELQAGHYLKLDDGKISITSWYNFEENIANTNVFTDHTELEEEYTRLLIDSVALRFRSDVPVGFNISGGLDSSILLAMVNHLYPNQNHIKAFSFYTNDKKYDELPWVRRMLKHTSNPLTTCLLRPQDVFERTATMCRMQDGPFGGIPTLAYSRVFEEARKEGVVVLLDGQGMDEAWAGYDYYTTNSGSILQGTITSPVRLNTLVPGFLNNSISFNWMKPFDDPIKNLQYRDLFYTKLPRALRFSDRVSMMYSTELREPFLDFRLVELAFAQNASMKIREGERKWTLRQIASKYLSTKIARAPKRALQTPQREWLAGILKSLVEQSIATLSDHPWFNADEMKKEWAAYLAGPHENSFFIWQWVNTAQLLTPTPNADLLFSAGRNRHKKLSVLPAAV